MNGGESRGNGASGGEGGYDKWKAMAEEEQALQEWYDEDEANQEVMDKIYEGDLMKMSEEERRKKVEGMLEKLAAGEDLSIGERMLFRAIGNSDLGKEVVMALALGEDGSEQPEEAKDDELEEAEVITEGEYTGYTEEERAQIEEFIKNFGMDISIGAAAQRLGIEKKEVEQPKTVVEDGYTEEEKARIEEFIKNFGMDISVDAAAQQLGIEKREVEKPKDKDPAQQAEENKAENAAKVANGGGEEVVEQEKKLLADLETRFGRVSFDEGDVKQEAQSEARRRFEREQRDIKNVRGIFRMFGGFLGRTGYNAEFIKNNGGMKSAIVQALKNTMKYTFFGSVTKGNYTKENLAAMKGEDGRTRLDKDEAVLERFLKSEGDGAIEVERGEKIVEQSRDNLVNKTLKELVDAYRSGDAEAIAKQREAYDKLVQRYRSSAGDTLNAQVDNFEQMANQLAEVDWAQYQGEEHNDEVEAFKNSLSMIEGRGARYGSQERETADALQRVIMDGVRDAGVLVVTAAAMQAVARGGNMLTLGLGGMAAGGIRAVVNSGRKLRAHDRDAAMGRRNEADYTERDSKIAEALRPKWEKMDYVGVDPAVAAGQLDKAMQEGDVEELTRLVADLEERKGISNEKGVELIGREPEAHKNYMLAMQEAKKMVDAAAVEKARAELRDSGAIAEEMARVANERLGYRIVETIKGIIIGGVAGQVIGKVVGVVGQAAEGIWGGIAKALQEMGILGNGTVSAESNAQMPEWFTSALENGSGNSGEFGPFAPSGEMATQSLDGAELAGAGGVGAAGSTVDGSSAFSGGGAYGGAANGVGGGDIFNGGGNGVGGGTAANGAGWWNAGEATGNGGGNAWQGGADGVGEGVGANGASADGAGVAEGAGGVENGAGDAIGVEGADAGAEAGAGAENGGVDGAGVEGAGDAGTMERLDFENMSNEQLQQEFAKWKEVNGVQGDDLELYRMWSSNVKHGLTDGNGNYSGFGFNGTGYGMTESGGNNPDVLWRDYLAWKDRSGASGMNEEELYKMWFADRAWTNEKAYQSLVNGGWGDVADLTAGSGPGYGDVGSGMVGGGTVGGGSTVEEALGEGASFGGGDTAGDAMNDAAGNVDSDAAGGYQRSADRVDDGWMDEVRGRRPGIADEMRAPGGEGMPEVPGNGGAPETPVDGGGAGAEATPGESAADVPADGGAAEAPGGENAADAPAGDGTAETETPSDAAGTETEATPGEDEVETTPDSGAAETPDGETMGETAGDGGADETDSEEGDANGGGEEGGDTSGEPEVDEGHAVPGEDGVTYPGDEAAGEAGDGAADASAGEGDAGETGGEPEVDEGHAVPGEDSMEFPGDETSGETAEGGDTGGETASESPEGDNPEGTSETPEGENPEEGASETPEGDGSETTSGEGEPTGEDGGGEQPSEDGGETEGTGETEEGNGEDAGEDGGAEAGGEAEDENGGEDGGAEGAGEDGGAEDTGGEAEGTGGGEADSGDTTPEPSSESTEPAAGGDSTTESSSESAEPLRRSDISEDDLPSGGGTVAQLL